MDERAPTLTVTELNRAAKAAVQVAFDGPVWVRGEIQRLVRSKPGHVYFDLVEKDELRDRVRSRVRVALFRDDCRQVERRLRDAGIALTDDIEVRVAGRPGIYLDRGEFQLVVGDVDPTFTVGKLAAERDRLLRSLASEGLLRANASNVLGDVPLRVGLVSSGGTAAYHDFVEELTGSGFAWRVVHADVRVQGNVAPRRLARAVRAIAACAVDVVVLVRGGGARTDLAAYDSEALARAIAGAGVPVLTGIGHETDRSVADEVAHTSYKTPTACARALVERVAIALDRVDTHAGRIARSARTVVADEHHRLVVAAQRVRRGARSSCIVAERDLAVTARRVARGAPASVRRSSARLGEAARRAPRVVPARLRRERALVADRGRRLARLPTRRLAAASHDTEGLSARVRALDPRRVLERGYTITRDRDGRVVRTTDGVVVGDVVATEFADGTVTSRVETT